MPVELDEIERRIMQLEIEREALRKEKDKASVERLAKLEKELADLKEERGRLAAHWQQEKEAIQTVRKLKEELEAVRQEVERAQRGGDYTKASELQYGRMPAARAVASEDAESPPGRASEGPADAQGRSGRGGHRRGRQQVDAHSGEPADGRRGPEARSHGGAAAPARDRPGRGDPRRGQRHPPRPGRAAGSEPPARQLPVPRSDRRRQDRARDARSPSSCSTPSRR